uniref:Uncharacterized protein n=1 Tax=Chromera velia CCMP2878 TaxID=1169474 RepID=A0A0G4ICC0_9ALVE|eukprot:Cvel_2242.t1-p1 / transcript=Cvel_2242.t1 / gene=Cvel_2242 / organism=Chromera_velia_CCMP2878 / gene_product=p21-activated protein kinase-interacting protein, putative / transcript_product=p21-activated protein kinase-interacting protein, putative / location=Cvel_scaffold86:91346-96262(+) / protein_length=534 / sequence_SO=supercontig / SO=protein_coding / is_pseudo=false
MTIIIGGSYDGGLVGYEYRELSKPREEGERAQGLFAFSPHIGCIKSAACSSKLLATGATDETIKLFDLYRLREVGTLMKHSSSVTALAFCEDKFLLSGGGNGELFVWRVEDWEPVLQLKGHKSEITALGVHPDGRVLLSVSSDLSFRLWDLMRGSCAVSKKLMTGPHSLGWLPGSQHYALCFGSKLEVSDAASASSSSFRVDPPTLQDGEEAGVLNGSDAPFSITCATFLSDDLVVFGANDGRLLLYVLRKLPGATATKTFLGVGTTEVKVEEGTGSASGSSSAASGSSSSSSLDAVLVGVLRSKHKARVKTICKVDSEGGKAKFVSACNEGVLCVWEVQRSLLNKALTAVTLGQGTGKPLAAPISLRPVACESSGIRLTTLVASSPSLSKPPPKKTKAEKDATKDAAASSGKKMKSTDVEGHVTKSEENAAKSEVKAASLKKKGNKSKGEKSQKKSKLSGGKVLQDGFSSGKGKKPKSVLKEGKQGKGSLQKKGNSQMKQNKAGKAVGAPKKGTKGKEKGPHQGSSGKQRKAR